jgi:hypothetical protein
MGVSAVFTGMERGTSLMEGRIADVDGTDT